MKELERKIVEEGTVSGSSFIPEYKITDEEESIKITVSDSYGATVSDELKQ